LSHFVILSQAGWLGGIIAITHWPVFRRKLPVRVSGASYGVFTRSSKHRANIELAQACLLEPRLLAQM